ncbi:MAG: hypothetical protein HQL35_08845 [Alphaproteobacteria bacterium]|nr:hypothetical protein [Alphaproteobacteria bacterium]
MTRPNVIHSDTRGTKPGRPTAAWLVLLSLMVQVLLPFGQALAFEPTPDGEVEYLLICTANGIKQVPLGDGRSPIESRQTVDFCPYCVTHAVSAVLPVAQILLGLPGETGPDRFATPSSIDHAALWRATPPPSRGPPPGV